MMNRYQQLEANAMMNTPGVVQVPEGQRIAPPPPPVAIEPGNIVVTEETFTPRLSDRMLAWAGSHPVLAFGLTAAVLYGGYRMTQGE
jgi:hypothetical protein